MRTPGDTRSFMSGVEISRLTKALTELGVCKIRLTGGEPTVRKDFFDILKDMKQNSNIPKVTMTTNGYRLNKIAKQLHESGLDGINISIDSLNRETFKKLTGHDRLLEILDGIKILQSLNFKNIKVNAVLLKDINDTYEDFEKFGNFIKDNKIDFRFIELMQTGDNLEYFKKNHVSSKIFKDYLEKNSWITVLAIILSFLYGAFLIFAIIIQVMPQFLIQNTSAISPLLSSLGVASNSTPIILNLVQILSFI